MQSSHICGGIGREMYCLNFPLDLDHVNKCTKMDYTETSQSYVFVLHVLFHWCHVIRRSSGANVAEKDACMLTRVSRLSAMKAQHEIFACATYFLSLSHLWPVKKIAYSEFIWSLMTVYVITGGFYCLPLKGLI